MGRVLCILLLALGLAPAQDTFDGAPRIVAVGDVHGGFNEFNAILKMAGITDGKDKWTGGKAHLVQTGDILDRGPDSRKVMDLLMSLETQAKRAGGMVHSLLGNHEAMNIYGDLRYVSKGEFEAFRTEDSLERLNSYFDQLVKAGTVPAEARKEWDADHPPGWVEHRLAFLPAGKYGKWMLAKNIVEKVNDSLFLHGGISPKYASLPISDINNQIRAALKDFSKLEGGIATVEEGPLWYRGLAEDPEEELAAHVDQLLAFHKVKRIVLGHTVQIKGITARFGGKVILIDVGLSKLYGGPWECLVIEGGKVQALRDGKYRSL